MVSKHEFKTFIWGWPTSSPETGWAAGTPCHVQVRAGVAKTELAREQDSMGIMEQVLRLVVQMRGQRGVLDRKGEDWRCHGIKELRERHGDMRATSSSARNYTLDDRREVNVAEGALRIFEADDASLD
ncbi:hypothetical protein BJ165DRAFT_1411435 [Panaeolus papilionaceus]|nr:hypothetical protein BJ165DRAFT_1411435 [Panaeolus papilionaceus]